MDKKKKKNLSTEFIISYAVIFARMQMKEKHRRLKTT